MNCWHYNHYNIVLLWRCVLCSIQNTDDDAMVQRSEQLYDQLSELYPGEVILEDRIYLTLGARIRFCDELGYPIVVLVGHKVCTCVCVHMQILIIRCLVAIYVFAVIR